MKLLISIVTIIEEEWLLEMPPMIINVTGNALPFEMRPKYHVSGTACTVGAMGSVGLVLVSAHASKSEREILARERRKS